MPRTFVGPRVRHRVRERDNCPRRAFPALGRALDLDEHRGTVSPRLVKQA